MGGIRVGNSGIGGGGGGFGGELGIGGVAARREEEACGLPSPNGGGCGEGRRLEAMRSVMRPTFLSVVDWSRGFQDRAHVS